MIGIHPGLHAEGVYEFWEPTLELLLDKNVKTAFTVLSEEEYVQVSDISRPRLRSYTVCVIPSVVTREILLSIFDKFCRAVG